jgi:spore coat protein U-like protein
MKNLKTFRVVAASVMALGVAVANAASVPSATVAGNAGTYDYMNVTSQNMTVQAEVVANCTVVVTGLDFGNYDPIVDHRSASNWLQSDATVTTECTQGSSPKVTVASASGFKLTKGADTLDYSLHTSPANVASGTAWPAGGEPIAATGYTDVATTVYGKLAGGQDKPVGAYSDTVVIDITF